MCGVGGEVEEVEGRCSGAGGTQVVDVEQGALPGPDTCAGYLVSFLGSLLQS